MITLASFLIGIGIVGLLESTIGNAAMLLITRKRQVTPHSRPVHSSSLDILIPAHNEQKLIQQTLAFVARSQPKTLTIQIHVGLDHCTDQTEDKIDDWASSRTLALETTTNPFAPGKWNTLQHLVSQSQADWVALVDVGSAWEEGLLQAVSPFLNDPEIMGIAPSYAPARCGRIEQYTWRIERFLKQMESKVGGPISVHGATVFYRRETLKKAFASLSPKLWLNDDVVIPLTLRAQNPQMRIQYLARKGTLSWVLDYGMQASKEQEYRRRKRMLSGNLQWIRELFWNACKADPKVGMIATRRVFRTFWAYWILVLSLGILLQGYGSASLPLSLFLTLALILLLSSKLRSAFTAGLEIPYHWIRYSRKNEEPLWN